MKETLQRTANCAHRWVWHNLDLAIWGCHFQQDNPYRGPSINDEDYLVGSLTSEWVTRQLSDITGKNQTQQSPFTKPYRLLTFMGGLSYYIIIFLSDCHILCKGWGQSAKLGKHSAIWGKLGTALQAYALNPCTKFAANPTSRKVNT